MNILLKKIEIHSGLSQETICFSAELYINGQKVGGASNHGHGGNTFYHATPEFRELLNEAEEWAKSQPDIELGYGAGTIPNSLESMIDDLVYAEDDRKQRQKLMRKMEKDMVKAIVVGVPNGTSYRSFIFKAPLQGILDMPNGSEILKKQIDAISSKMEEGEQILNTNLPAELIPVQI